MLVSNLKDLKVFSSDFFHLPWILEIRDSIAKLDIKIKQVFWLNVQSFRQFKDC